MLYSALMGQTPVGPLKLVSDGHYIIRIDFDKAENTAAERYLTKWLGCGQATPGNRPELDAAAAQLAEYFAGKRRTFDLPIKFFGTEFYQKCWTSLQSIAYGQTISYKELAARVGSPRAFRAVGQANHHNPLAIVVPCHRVVAGNGLGGYGGGLEAKRHLLALEGGPQQGSGRF